MSNRASWNTAAGLRRTLELLPPDLLIVLSLDPAGNAYAPLGHCTENHLYAPEPEQNPATVTPCMTLWPRPVLSGQQTEGLTVRQICDRLLRIHPGAPIVLAHDPEGNTYSTLRAYSYGRLYYNPAADTAHALSADPQSGPECAVFWPR
ncbi:hypothetical protein [Planomonospora parontospora]|uniref:hypothetical protein n=1 Tax=Planomonospora parontospora TaxID=58119 RepID=UPI0016717813|nr:hypothetical protein [Planomonospora parontospora]GII18795.1 hypothetical protein Ppa05_55210 [Planomonospora parontospora subsp. antibiotica]